MDYLNSSPNLNAVTLLIVSFRFPLPCPPSQQVSLWDKDTGMKNKDIEVSIRLNEGDTYSILRAAAPIELSGVILVSTAVVTSTTFYTLRHPGRPHILIPSPEASPDIIS